jgi:hypothetical protein
MHEISNYKRTDIPHEEAKVVSRRSTLNTRPQASKQGFFVEQNLNACN